MGDPKCKKCKFFKLEEGKIGWCRRYPKVEKKKKTDVCGEYKRA